MNARTLSSRPPGGTALAAASLAALLLVLRAAVHGTLGTGATSVLAPVLLVACAAGILRALSDGASWSETLRAPSLHVVVLGAAIGLPCLGGFGLVDPWETHYAEVAREMIERRDLVSPWWAHEGWFMTKPVLTFWLEAAAMVVLGVRTGPDAILGGGLAHPEWAVRLPAFALALAGSLILHHGLVRTCGRRAALLGAVVLWTMPGFALLARQGMTDMPLVGCVAASLGLLLRATSTSDAVLVRTRVVRIGARSFELHAGHVLAAAIALVIVPQIVALLLQHVHLGAGGLRVGADRLVAGSPHACHLPGQPPCVRVQVAHPLLSPVAQATLWIAPAAWLVARAAEETRAARLAALGAWLFAGLAAMAKGPAGLAVPAAAACVYALSRRSLRPLFRLEIGPGLVLAVAMIAPWYLAIYARHGRGFIDELVMRHMLGRTLEHLHDTNEAEDVGIVYFVRQLAYGTFPWSGVALAGAFAIGKDDRSRRAGARAILFGAAIVAFALVSIMRTKFHHYVLVALPPIAALAGLWLDEAIAARAARPRASAASVGLVVAALALVVVGLDVTSADGGGPGSFVRLFTYRYSRAWPAAAAFSRPLAIVLAVAAAGLVASAFARLRRAGLAVTATAALAVTILLGWVYLPRCAADGGQREVLAAYYADRPPGERAPIVAYQLNWKGENFYTGNHVAIFVASGAPLGRYLAERRTRGERTVYFVTERGRVGVLRGELGTVETFDELTPPPVSAEFTLVRARL